MASKCRNMFQKNKTRETTENAQKMEAIKMVRKGFRYGKRAGMGCYNAYALSDVLGCRRLPSPATMAKRKAAASAETSPATPQEPLSNSFELLANAPDIVPNAPKKEFVPPIVLNETHLKPHTKLYTPGYIAVRNDRVGRNGGGVAILIKEPISFRQIDLPTDPGGTETLGIKVILNKRSTPIINVYNPPNVVLKECLLRNLFDYGGTVIVFGDFNARHRLSHCIRKNTNGANMYDFVMNRGATLFAPERPTYMPSHGKGSQSTLDLVLANSAKKTDWEAFRCELNNAIPTAKPPLGTAMDIDTAVVNFTEEITAAIRASTPTITPKPQKLGLPEEILDLIRDKNKPASTDMEKAEQLALRFAAINNNSVNRGNRSFNEKVEAGVKRLITGRTNTRTQDTSESAERYRGASAYRRIKKDKDWRIRIQWLEDKEELEPVHPTTPSQVARCNEAMNAALLTRWKKPPIGTPKWEHYSLIMPGDHRLFSLRGPVFSFEYEDPMSVVCQGIFPDSKYMACGRNQKIVKSERRTFLASEGKLNDVYSRLSKGVPSPCTDGGGTESRLASTHFFPSLVPHIHCVKCRVPSVMHHAHSVVYAFPLLSQKSKTGVQGREDVFKEVVGGSERNDGPAESDE
ncbi:hypothetical protein AAG570_010835 [Ranatra chinensis]|uniref:Endonuclease/exonuclease/phosphatase domain-containing protein n=1 Tax=Ranatra chinensis TaxID=642074 RepID=A0ABD0YV37_9HEMI